MFWRIEKRRMTYSNRSPSWHLRRDLRDPCIAKPLPQKQNHQLFEATYGTSRSSHGPGQVGMLIFRAHAPALFHLPQSFQSFRSPSPPSTRRARNDSQRPQRRSLAASFQRMIKRYKKI